MAVNTSSDKAEQILAWAQHGEEFTGGAVAAELGVESHAVGSALRGLVSRGALQIGQPTEGGKRTYKLTPVEAPDVADYDPDAFIPNLKDALADRLAALHEERNQLDSQLRAIDDEAGRIRAAYGVLKD